MPRSPIAMLACLLLATAGAVAAGGRQPAAAVAACPAHALAAVPANRWGAARSELVPRGPLALRLCRYAGRNSALPLALVRSRVLGRSALLARLVSSLDALPPFPRAPILCPLDDGSAVLALLRYGGGERVTVSLELTGCRRVGNGDLVRLASGYHDTAGAARLVSSLRRLTAPARGGARVHGLIRLCGGAILPDGHMRCFSQGGSVTVLDATGDVVAAQAAPHGRFSFALPPGTYTLLASTRGLHAQPRTVTLAAGRLRRVNLIVPVP